MSTKFVLRPFHSLKTEVHNVERHANALRRAVDEEYSDVDMYAKADEVEQLREVCAMLLKYSVSFGVADDFANLLFAPEKDE